MGNGNRSNGYSNKVGSDGNGDNRCNGDCNERWRAMKWAMARAARAMTTATKRAMATTAKSMAMGTKKAMAMDGEGNVDEGKSDCEV